MIRVVDPRDVGSAIGLSAGAVKCLFVGLSIHRSSVLKSFPPVCRKGYAKVMPTPARRIDEVLISAANDAVMSLCGQEGTAPRDINIARHEN